MKWDLSSNLLFETKTTRHTSRVQESNILIFYIQIGYLICYSNQNTQERNPSPRSLSTYSSVHSSTNTLDPTRVWSRNTFHFRLVLMLIISIYAQLKRPAFSVVHFEFKPQIPLKAISVFLFRSTTIRP